MTQEDVLNIVLGNAPGTVRLHLLRQAVQGGISLSNLPEVGWTAYSPAVVEITRRAILLDPDNVEADGRCFFYQQTGPDSMPYWGHAVSVENAGGDRQIIGVESYDAVRWMPPGKTSLTITINLVPHAG